MKGLENAFYAGIGWALKGKEKIEELAKQVAKDSQMNAKDGKAFVAKAVKEADTAKKELKKHIDQTVETTVKKMGFISKKEADQLKAQIKTLQAQLGKTKKTAAKKTPAKKAAKKK